MKANVALPGPHQTLQLLEPVLYEDGLSPEPVSSMPTWELWSLPEMPWALLPRSGRWPCFRAREDGTVPTTFSRPHIGYRKASSGAFDSAFSPQHRGAN